ncbi:MAG TPA: tail fiber protein [Xanthobacteraceae bacterium]|jgi:microcystin-dependent protein
MTQPFVGQVQAFGFGFAPRYWAQCNGQTLAIAQNQALFALLGTTYGGNGVSTFLLPNLQSRVPMHYGTAPYGTVYTLGEIAGSEQVGLTLGNLPLHNHTLFGSTGTATVNIPAAGQALATAPSAANFVYGPDTTPQPLNPASITPAGTGQPHNNLQPYQAINFCIALYGIFPSRG